MTSNLFKPTEQSTVYRFFSENAMGLVRLLPFRRGSGGHSMSRRQDLQPGA